MGRGRVSLAGRFWGKKTGFRSAGENFLAHECSCQKDGSHDSRRNGSTDIARACFTMKIGLQEMLCIGVVQLGIAGGGGVMLAAIQADIWEVLEPSTFDAAVFRAIAKDDVASADDACVAIGVEKGIGIAGVEDVVG